MIQQLQMLLSVALAGVLHNAAAQVTAAENAPFMCVLTETDERGAGRNYSIWENQIVPYKMTPEIDQPTILRFRQILDTFMANTNLCFVPAIDEEKYLSVYFSQKNYFYSTGTDIYVGKGCGACPHELGHSLGLIHEQNRPDRDSFVTVFPENIDPAFIDQFAKVEPQYASDYTITPVYDYASMMHYSYKAFSINDKPTIVGKNGQTEFGGYYPTATDFQVLNLLYPEKIDCATIRKERPPGAQFTYKALDQLCEGSAVQTENLTENTDAAFEWTVAGGVPEFSTAKNPLIAFPKPGDYYINLKATNAYGSTTTFKLIHIENCHLPVIFDYWSNPTSGRMTLFFYRIQPKNIAVTAYNVTGQPVFTTTISQGDEFPSQVEFNFPDDIPSGTYFLQFRMGDQVQLLKVVLVH